MVPVTSLYIRSVRRISLAAAAVAIAGTMLTGCSAISDLLPKQSDQGTASQDAGEGSETDVFALAVGDCMNDTSAETVSSLPTVPCSDKHDYEVYYEFELPGDTFPGDDATTAAAEQGCADQFEAFAGIPYDSSALNFSYLTPTEHSWTEMDDHLVSCLIFDTAGQVSDTLRGAAR